MTIGYFIVQDDRTTCGGRVIESDSRMTFSDVSHAREGDRVTCGVDGKIYQIKGGISNFTSHGRRVAGTLDSVSGCPCRAQLIPSIDYATYVKDEEPATPKAHRPSPPAKAFTVTPAPLVAEAPPAPAFTGRPVVEEIEEEEEEVELEQLITLHLGVFFDGTGNNRDNSESVAGCRASDVGLQDLAEEFRRFCETHGYGPDGTAPDSSYGNDASNIARLYDLYEDQADVKIDADAEKAALAVYIEGIGTVNRGADATYSMATGRLRHGVLARVQQTPSLILRKLRSFAVANPDVRIRRIVIDVFGFSRGAAAARHFVNDLRKGAFSLLAKAATTQSEVFVDGYAWRLQQDIVLNFIGLFDTVPGIVSPLVGDFSPGDARVSGLQLALPQGIARKVVQFVARDEFRQNFALVRTDHDIVLPGAHSDIGGGYLPSSRERVFVTRPQSSNELLDLPIERSGAFSRWRDSTDSWLHRLTAAGIEIRPESWSVDLPPERGERFPRKRVYVAGRVDREIAGDLSKVYLRIMRELGLRQGVPFKAIPQTPKFAFPEELTSIADKLQAYALGESAYLMLTEAEESLLMRRYIHLSSHWNALNNFRNSDLDVLFINRPADDYQRVIHGNQ